MFVESCDQRLLRFRLPRREDDYHNHDYAEYHTGAGHRAGPNLLAGRRGESAGDHRHAPPNLGGTILPAEAAVKKNRVAGEAASRRPCYFAGAVLAAAGLNCRT